jgi:hypothetical protein
MIAKQIAGRDVREAKLAVQMFGLRPLARSRRAQKDDIHLGQPDDTRCG